MEITKEQLIEFAEIDYPVIRQVYPNEVFKNTTQGLHELAIFHSREGFVKGGMKVMEDGDKGQVDKTKYEDFVNVQSIATASVMEMLVEVTPLLEYRKVVAQKMKHTSRTYGKVYNESLSNLYKAITQKIAIVLDIRFEHLK